MSRFSGEINSKPILDAAAHWRDVALLQDVSVFANRHLWTAENLAGVDEYFIQHPDAGEGRFWDKLKGQLDKSPAAVKQLMSEMTWLMLLCPSNILSAKKRDQITMVWEWSGEPFPRSAASYMTDSVLRGVGSAGPGFNNHRWREVEFCTNVCRSFKRLGSAERRKTLEDPWSFAEWLQSVPSADVRQLRHMLLFLLFPDTFERVFGQTDRRAIVAAFTNRTPYQAGKLGPIGIDKELAKVRRALTEEYGTADLDFYVSPLEERWKPEEPEEHEVEETETVTADQGDELDSLIRTFLEQAKSGIDLATRKYSGTYKNLEVRASFGQGTFARVPWIAFLGKGQTVQRGIYPVILFFREQNLLLLCYGVSQTNSPAIEWKDLKARSVRDVFRAKFGRDPPNYGASYVLAEFDTQKPLPMEELKTALESLVRSYKVALEEATAEEISTPPNQDLPAAVHSFSEALKEAFVSFGARHEKVVRSFVASLLTKPFVILTGLSGSGKTQIAMKFCEWVGSERLYVAPVRPDWTGPEALLGYEDGLKAPIAGFAVWNVPGILEHMLRAADDPSQPYILLLDEMNLAHVERYFADVLSGIESAQPCLPNLIRDSSGSWRMKSIHGQRVPFPRNLWIIGTVNVDETTYMFSPKVLDRATTFEFRVETSELKSDGQKPKPCSAGDGALIRGLVQVASDDDWHRTHAASFQEALGIRLSELHRVLSRFSLEFGHRVFYESMRFAALAERIGISEQNDVLDLIVLQKVLPRLHGSRRRLEAPLLALAHFCRDLPDEVASEEKIGDLKVDSLEGAKPALPDSYTKVCRMLKNLRVNQFVSFAE